MPVPSLMARQAELISQYAPDNRIGNRGMCAHKAVLFSQSVPISNVFLAREIRSYACSNSSEIADDSKEYTIHVVHSYARQQGRA